jgi:long-chain fatty acid transport protein
MGRMKTTKQFTLTVAITRSAILLTAATAAGEGFRNSPPSAFNLGRAGGRIAQIDDASAVQQNPANLADLPLTELQLAPSVIYYSTAFKSTNGQTSKSQDPWKMLPNGFGSMPLFDGNLSLGVGLTVPFGLSNDWDPGSPAFAHPTGVLRYQTPYSAELKTINANPAVGLKLGDHLRLGAGVDLMWSELTLKQFYPWLIFPGSVGTEPDGEIQAKGNGWSVGGNAGLTWLITPSQRFAVTYRSPMTVDYNGDFKISNVTPTAAFLGVTPQSDFSTSIGFPSQVAAGYGLEITDSVRVELDAEWIQFSRFKSLDLNVGNNALLFPSTHLPQNWKDTFTAGIGGDWRFASNWVMRAGYQFYQSPVPDSTFSPTIPDANQNVFTFGLGFHYKRHFLELAYGADFYSARHIRNDENPAFNGDYQTRVHLFSLTYHYSF